MPEELPPVLQQGPPIQKPPSSANPPIADPLTAEVPKSISKITVIVIVALAALVLGVIIQLFNFYFSAKTFPTSPPKNSTETPIKSIDLPISNFSDPTREWQPLAFDSYWDENLPEIKISFPSANNKQSTQSARTTQLIITSSDQPQTSCNINLLPSFKASPAYLDSAGILYLNLYRREAPLSFWKAGIPTYYHNYWYRISPDCIPFSYTHLTTHGYLSRFEMGGQTDSEYFDNKAYFANAHGEEIGSCSISYTSDGHLNCPMTANEPAPSSSESSAVVLDRWYGANTSYLRGDSVDINTFSDNMPTSYLDYKFSGDKTQPTITARISPHIDLPEKACIITLPHPDQNITASHSLPAEFQDFPLAADLFLVNTFTVDQSTNSAINHFYVLDHDCQILHQQTITTPNGGIHSYWFEDGEFNNQRPPIKVQFGSDTGEFVEGGTCLLLDFDQPCQGYNLGELRDLTSNRFEPALSIIDRNINYTSSPILVLTN